MQKKNIGNVIIMMLAIINIGLWLTFLPGDDGTRQNFTRQLVGEVLGTSAIVLLACVLVLATRARFLEPYFGGLDRMYQSHKATAMTAFFVILVHFFSVPLDANKIKIGTPLGVIAFVGLLVLVLLTIAPRIPVIGRLTNFAYHKWRKSHRLIGIFFIIAFIHAMQVEPLLRNTFVPFLYVLMFFFVGTGAYVYRIWGSQNVRKLHPYLVESVRKLNGTTTELTLKPQGEPLVFTSGQFLFVNFKGNKILEEPHPFTISSSPKESNLRLSIKATGDYTRYLHQTLETGVEAMVEGSYGAFSYKQGSQQQIWIAGGIGITPFLSWIRDLNRKFDFDVDFYYTVRTHEEALFLNEIEAASRRYSNFRPHLTCSLKEGSLTVEKIVESSQGNIVDKHVYMCGPIKMIDGFRKKFHQLGVAPRNIHNEEFNFR